MKTILITIALFGFTVMSSYAQNTKSCTCKKTVYHKTTHQKVALGIKTTRPPLYTSRTHNVSPYPGNDVWKSDAQPLAPTTPLDVNSMEYSTESSYSGNYPKPTLQYTKVDPRENSSKRPEVDVLCLYDCPAKVK
jgi:hypothetical protein